MNRAKWPDHAGLIGWTRSRQTGLYVGVYNGALADLDTANGTEPWSTVCESHSGVLAHRTRAQAFSWAPLPGTWCPVCQTRPRCPHDDRVLMWAEDQWVCFGLGGCGDEWTTDVFPAPSKDSEWSGEAIVART